MIGRPWYSVAAEYQNRIKVLSEMAWLGKMELGELKEEFLTWWRIVPKDFYEASEYAQIRYAITGEWPWEI